MTKKGILIPNNTSFNFIEKITSGAMKFLNDKNSTNDGRKWYLVKLKFISLEQLNKKNLIKIVLKKGNENANFFSVYSKKKIGEMLFLKK